MEFVRPVFTDQKQIPVPSGGATGGQTPGHRKALHGTDARSLRRVRASRSSATAVVHRESGNLSKIV